MYMGNEEMTQYLILDCLQDPKDSGMILMSESLELSPSH